ncbi:MULTISPECIES: YitT family protein [unclassified Granulicatella]|uniref:YczE/YyaS/YitT family protein n=1 Tax=unclassified Granulicatella TaxID=2630493 RepID=UPI001073F110|nr:MULTISPECIES: hypothetical protein [unclassified Granulicatella]MBF0780780.1 hypothetical protein [Granulicatella sp. 19428wC4_WM01]TFU93853.1 hypothetical protein E4T68_06670 [Granulicatella sp. WM01]
MKKFIANISLTTIGIIFAAVGVSMTLKANVGVGSINAFSKTLSGISTIHVGTILILVNVACVFAQFALQRDTFHWRQWLQLGVSYLLGEIVNIMVYYVFSSIVLDTYIVRLMWFILGSIICSVTVALIIRLNLVVFPVEAMCHVIAEKYNLSFKRVRQVVDIAAIILVVVLVLIAQGEMTIREGTLLNVIIFPTMIQSTLTIMEKYNVFSTIQYKDC